MISPAGLASPLLLVVGYVGEAVEKVRKGKLFILTFSSYFGCGLNV